MKICSPSKIHISINQVSYMNNTNNYDPNVEKFDKYIDFPTFYDFSVGESVNLFCFSFFALYLYIYMLIFRVTASFTLMTAMSTSLCSLQRLT